MPLPYTFKAYKLFLEPILRPIVRPITRVLVGFIALPAFRWIVKNIFRVKELDAETEKDLGEWFRGSAILLFATPNMEAFVGSMLGIEFDIDNELISTGPIVEAGDGGLADSGGAIGADAGGADASAASGAPDPGQEEPPGEVRELSWLILGGRLLLAVAAIESMPDQHLFSIIHPGPPKVIYEKAVGIWGSIKKQWLPVLRGLACLHLNRASPVFAILAVILDDEIGWICFGLAIAQYLIIGLVTSRDRALDVLMQFDQKMAERRREIIEEFNIQQSETAAPIDMPPPTKVVHLR